MVKHILREVCSGSLEQDRIGKLVEMVGQLEHIEIVKVRGYAKAWIVLVVQWLVYRTS